jgi:PAS domain-containing protein
MLASVNDIATEWYVDPNRRAEFRDILTRDGRVEDFVSEVYRHKTRERIWITESARIVCDPKTGKPLYYEGSVREITETIRRQQLEEQIQKLTDQLPGGLFQFRRSPNGS